MNDETDWSDAASELSESSSEHEIGSNVGTIRDVLKVIEVPVEEYFSNGL